MMVMVYLLLIVFGLSFGSFVNALVWRIHDQEEIREKNRRTKADEAALKRLSISRGHSMCLSCKHELRAIDLVPVVSWLWLRGKCRYCGARIPDTPLVELLVPGLFVISYVWWPYELAGWSILPFALWLAALVALVALALYDVRWYLLPNRIVFPLIALALAYRISLAFLPDQQLFGVLLAGFWGVISLAGLFFVLFTVSNERWIGGGDVKLAVALGLFAGGPLAALLLLFIASTAGSLAAIPMLARGQSVRQARVPFGPFLIAGTVVTVLYGAAILRWYTGLFLP
jgi:leader peptidase (prepilin peptidase)/N-methyltransferase